MKFFFTGPVCPAGIALSLRQRQRYRLLIFLMRVSCTYIVLMILSLQVLLANKGRGQNLDQIKVTIGLQNENLKTLFDQIELQTGLSFAFTPMDIEGAPTVSLPRATRSVKSTLDLALVGTYLRYEQVNQNVIVSKGEAGLSEGPYVAFSIRGKVTNSLGEVMPGVSIYVKGTTRGTTTDAEGIYVISAEANDVLVFSFVGFKTQEVNVDARGVIDVGMEDDAASLGEVVVNAGYWNVKDRERTGSISRVSGDNIQNQPVSNPLQAISGRMPGVYINQANGISGGQINIQIRGQNSLRTSVDDNGNNPLFIVDGVPYAATSMSSTYIPGPLPFANPLNNINPNDIESVEVLKDADATAIYGARGANGVILITTKKGKEGKTMVEANISTGIGSIARKVDLLNTHEYIRMRKEAFLNDNEEPSLGNALDLLEWDTTRYTDWQKELIGGTAKLTSAQLSISGGTNGTQFTIGGNLHKETTVFPGNQGLTRGSGHFNLQHKSPNNKFATTLNTTYSETNNNLPYQDLTPIALTLAPNAPSIYNADGSLNWSWENPLSFLKNKYKTESNNLIANGTLGYKLIPGLEIKSRLGFNSIQQNEIQARYIAAKNPILSKKTAAAFYANSNIKTWIIEPQLDYNVKLNDGDLTATIGGTFQQNKSKNQTLSLGGFTNDVFVENPRAATTVTIPVYNYELYRYNAVFSRIGYNWKGKYILNLTGRRDGSSRFGPNKKFANFGAVGAAWIFSNESFIENALPMLSFGKLRSSYGITGSDQIPSYGYLDAYSPTQYTYESKSGLEPIRLANVDYSWETNKKLEINMELGFIKDRLLISANWYRNRSSNQLVGYPLSTVTGFSEIRYNLPAVIENRGWEIELTTRNITTNDVSWTTSINVTIPKSKLVSYPGIEKSSYNTSKEVGKSNGIIKSVHSLGVDPKTGIYLYEDVDNDGSISSPNDIRALKTLEQKYYGGLTNTIRYRAFQIDIFFQFVKQSGINYLAGPFTAPGSFNPYAGYSGNQPSIVKQRWQKPGDIASIQRFTEYYASDAINAYYTKGDMMYSDASFIRLKNVTLSWSIPNKWAERLKFQNSKIFIQGQNLITITNYLGDPETQNIAVLPPLKMITIGAQFHL